MRVGPKFDAFLDHRAQAEFLEGVTAAGKTTVGVYKFMLEAADSEKSQHILAGLDTGTIEKNIINREHGILDEWGALAEYRGRGAGDDRLPHILFHTPRGDRIIYVLGYDNSLRWKKALGGQYGCVYVDEMNIADIDFLREAAMRCDYLIGTLNPDDPELPVYKEFVNHSRPLAPWAGDTPESILRQLETGEPKPGWTHWFFGFGDNIALTAEKVERIRRNVPRGTKLWKNKIEGLRGRAEGLVFPNFSPARHVKSAAWLRREIEAGRVRFRYLAGGLDTSYSVRTPDTVAMVFLGVTEAGTLIVLEERVLNNAARAFGGGGEDHGSSCRRSGNEAHSSSCHRSGYEDNKKLFAPSDIAAGFAAFLEESCRRWGPARSAFVDCADQATLTELWKYRRDRPCPFLFVPSHKIPVMDRIHLQLGWLESGDYLVLDRCPEHIRELTGYLWADSGGPEDRNDHTINACQYAWTPYRDRIGKTGGIKE